MKTTMKTEQLDQLLCTYRDGLLDDTLPFWINNAVDYDDGGFHCALDRDGSLLDSDKSVWQQGRFSWLLAHLYNNVEQREEWLALAKHGVEFINKHCIDPNDGLMWFTVTKTGTPVRKRRYRFTETFACIAMAELAKATNDNQLKQQAIDLFDLYQRENRCSSQPAKFTDEYLKERPMRGLGIPMIDIFTCQILRDTIDLPNATEIIDGAIADIERFHVKDDIRCVMETVSLDGEIIEHFDGRLLNPGHAIEGAWFIMDEGRKRGIQRYIDLGLRMLDYSFERGWDQEFGGVLYYRDVYGKPVQEYWQDMKFWWPQNELIIASLMAYQITGLEKYQKMHKQAHDWAYKYFPDQEYGEWYGYLNRDGRPSFMSKGTMWKGPFHHPRMQLFCWKLAEELKKQAIK